MRCVTSAAHRRRRSASDALVLVTGGAVAIGLGLVLSDHSPAFDDGWAFGIALVAFGLATLGTALRSGRRVA